MVAPYKLHKPISRSSYNEKDRVSDCTIGLREFSVGSVIQSIYDLDLFMTSPCS